VKPAWDRESNRQFVRALAWRRSRTGLGLDRRGPSRGEAVLDWLERVAFRSPLGGAIGDRFPTELPEGELSRQLEADMDRCQKPFQLWNVAREVRSDPFALEEQDAYRIGAAAALAESAGRALRDLEPATRELIAAEGERAREWVERDMWALAMIRSLPTSFGRADPDEEEG